MRERIRVNDDDDDDDGSGERKQINTLAIIIGAVAIREYVRTLANTTPSGNGHIQNANQRNTK